jgi:palmitoyltransferase
MGEKPPVYQVVLLAFAGMVFSLVLLPFSGFHAYMICKNRTTIENMERQTISLGGRPRSEVNPAWFDLGVKENWRQVMGHNPWLWFLPVPTT